MKLFKTLLLSATLFLSGLAAPAFAASITDTGLVANSSVCTDTLANLVTTGCSSGVPFIQIFGSGIFGIGNLQTGALTNTPINFSNDYQIPVGMVIGHLNVTCENYNPVDAAANQGQYTTLNSTGLGGGTVNFYITNATHSVTSNPLLIGSVVLPTSPQAGPYITNVTSVVSSPYTVLSDDVIILNVTSASSATQKLEACMPYIGP